MTYVHTKTQILKIFLHITVTWKVAVFFSVWDDLCLLPCLNPSLQSILANFRMRAKPKKVNVASAERFWSPRSLIDFKRCSLSASTTASLLEATEKVTFPYSALFQSFIFWKESQWSCGSRDPDRDEQRKRERRGERPRNRGYSGSQTLSPPTEGPKRGIWSRVLCRVLCVRNRNNFNVGYILFLSYSMSRFEIHP